MHVFFQRLLLVALPLSVSSCTASLELDRFKRSEATLDNTPVSTTLFDVRFNAKSMQSHINEYFEIRVVDKDNRINAKVVYVGVVAPDFSFYLRGAVPRANAPYRLDFWADHNNSFKYDGIQGGINDKDHAWRRVLSEPLPEDVRFANGRFELDFLHDTAFVDIATDLAGNKISAEDTLLPFNLKVVGAEPFLGKRLEVHVVDKGSGRLVGVHRKGRADDSYTAQITGILDEATTYVISAFADVNDSGHYDAGDPSWKVELTSTRNGIETDFDVSTLPKTPIDVGER